MVLNYINLIIIIFRTDGQIQDTIRNRFSDITILSIAHRVETVMDMDRIMVCIDVVEIVCHLY